jgi:DNA (cytosine-5)-methyltransferase 1
VSGAYYNEHDPFAAAWLRALIDDGLIAPGDVDERDMRQVPADDLKPYRQCHFFAGIGGWSYALRLAGWPDERPVWTGSCPCQPFSGAGQRKGHADERHLWPAFYALIAQRWPPVVFGEQVAGALGYEWLAGVRADFEDGGYAVGAADLCAAGVGAPHIRQRLWWVADSAGQRRDRGQQSGASGVSSSSGAEAQERRAAGLCESARCGADDGLGDAHVEGRPRQPLGLLGSGDQGHWSRAEWLACSDGKARRVEPGIFPLAHGVPNRVGTLRGAGNAIVPQVAAQFVGAWLDLVNGVS